MMENKLKMDAKLEPESTKFMKNRSIKRCPKRGTCKKLPERVAGVAGALFFIYNSLNNPYEGGSSWLNAEPFTMAGQLPEPAPGFPADDGMTEFSMLVKCCLERALIFGLTSPPRETRSNPYIVFE